MFGRCIRDKRPAISAPVEQDEEMWDRDKEQKEKGEEYGDAKRRAQPSEIDEGNYVLAKKQVAGNKLTAPFETTIYKVIKRSGSEAIIQSVATLATFRRNVAHLKKLANDVAEQQLISSTAHTAFTITILAINF